MEDIFAAVQFEKIHLTLTLRDIDALHKAGSAIMDKLSGRDRRALETALQKLDEAVNL